MNFKYNNKKAFTYFDEDLLEEIEHKICEATRFTITDHSVIFHGVCEACKNNAVTDNKKMFA